MQRERELDDLTPSNSCPPSPAPLVESAFSDADSEAAVDPRAAPSIRIGGLKNDSHTNVASIGAAGASRKERAAEQAARADSGGGDGDDDAKEEEDDEEDDDEPMSLEDELRYYVQLGDLEKIRELTQRGVSVDTAEDISLEEYQALDEMRKQPDYDPTLEVHPKVTGNYPIHIAAQFGHTAVVKQLVFLGANVDRKNRIGSTALHRAVSMNKVDTVTELIQRGANVQARNNMGQTPLHIAVACGHVEIIQILLDTSAKHDLKVKNLAHMTPVAYATPGSPELAVLLEFDPRLANAAEDDE